MLQKFSINLYSKNIHQNQYATLLPTQLKIYTRQITCFSIVIGMVVEKQYEKFHPFKRSRLRGFRNHTEKHQITLRPKVFPNYSKYSPTLQIPQSLPDFWPETFILQCWKHGMWAYKSSPLSYFQILSGAEERCLPNVITPSLGQPTCNNQMTWQYKGPDPLLQFGTTLRDNSSSSAPFG